MRILQLGRVVGLCLIVVLPILLIASCSTGADNLIGRMTAANLLAASAAQSLVTATQAGAIEPGSETATAIIQTLDAVARSLDSAGSALRAGLPEMASRNLDAAEQQLNILQPMLPAVPADRSKR
jgi:hypothetical protein